MLVVGGVPLALLATCAAGHRTRLDGRAQEAGIERSLADDDASGGIAQIGAVEVETDAADQPLHIVLAEAGIGAGSAGSGTRDALVDATHERVAIDARRLRMRTDYFSNRHGLAFRAR